MLRFSAVLYSRRESQETANIPRRLQRNRIDRSGAGTNWKLGEGGIGPERKLGAPEKFCLVVPLHFFGSKSTISRFGERFCDGQYSLVSFLFAVLLLTVPPVPSHL